MKKILLALALALSVGVAFAQTGLNNNNPGSGGGGGGTVQIDQTTPGTTNGVQLKAGSAIAGKVGIDQTTPGTTNGVQINAALPAGTNLIGKTGIDQTTPGTTNGVQVNAALPTGTNVIGGANLYQGGTAVDATHGVYVQPGTGASFAPPSVQSASANFNRPADTTAYAIGDLVANSTTAGSVVALSWDTTRTAFNITKVRLQKSNTSLTNAAFRIHLYGADPAASSGIINGDNGVWLTKVGTYLGWMDVLIDKAFNDAAKGVSVPGQIYVKLASGTTVYALIEARGAYTPANAETFTAEIEYQ